VLILDLVLRGEASAPKLLFDKKEVLLPVVPLGVEAHGNFKVINDGYDNLNVKY